MALHRMAVTPDNSGYAVELGNEALVAEFGGGLGRYRADTIGAASKASVTWIVGSTDYRYLVAFYNTHRGGAKPFLINLILNDSTLTEYTAHFIPGTWKVVSIVGQ